MSKVDERNAEDAAVNTPAETLERGSSDARRAVEGVREATGEDAREGLATERSGEQSVEGAEPVVGPGNEELDTARASLDNG